MMQAAIYARRSTEEHQEASLDVQVSEATRYINEKGWSLDPSHVYIDDAVSRAEFKKRPGLIALLNTVEAGLIDVVVTRDESRLGGDMTRTGLLISDIIDGGARLFYYYSNEEVSLDTAVDKFMVAARNFASELEREKISQRTHEHLLSKARRGLNVGGRCYGYDNVEITDDQGRRVRVEYAINDHQADVIREIFRRYVDGAGLRTIAKALNERGEPSPRAGKRGTGSWSPGVIREMLRRDRYRGVASYNKIEKTYRGGTKVRVPRPQEEWIEIPVPHLQIVDEELWASVAGRFDKRARNRPATSRRGRPPKYLLSGFSRCAECGGPLKVSNGRQGSKAIKVYGCAYHRDRGNSVCSNTLRRPVETINEAVTSWVRRHVLTEETIVEALKEVRRRLRDRQTPGASEIPDLESETRDLKRQIDGMTEALAAAAENPVAVVKAITEREERLGRATARLETLRKAPSVLDKEVRRMEKEARRRLDDLKNLLERNPAEARKVMETVLDGPLTFTPIRTQEGPRYEIRGPLSLVELFAIEGFTKCSVPSGIRTRVTGVKGQRPGPD